MVLRARRRAGVLLWRLLRRPTTASNTASSNGVYYGGGATKATGVYCQFNEGDTEACSAVRGSARLAFSVAGAEHNPHLSGSRQLEVPMKGTILDFLKLAAEKPELAQELVELAAKHDFEFTDEVSDEELEKVAGGLTAIGGQRLGSQPLGPQPLPGSGGTGTYSQGKPVLPVGEGEPEPVMGDLDALNEPKK